MSGGAVGPLQQRNHARYNNPLVFFNQNPEVEEPTRSVSSAAATLMISNHICLIVLFKVDSAADNCYILDVVLLETLELL
jgi:hypothetical protein